MNVSHAFATRTNPGSAECNTHIQPPPGMGHSTSISSHILGQYFSPQSTFTFHSQLMAPKLALLGLPISVFRLILDLLERSDIDTFRLTSRACSYACEPVVFRNVTIHDRTSMAYAINEDICDRLGNSKDALSHHVRHLQIGPLTKEDRCPSERALIRALNSLRNLQDFS
jgi:hypothetical protein